MVHEAPANGIPLRGAYMVREPHVADALTMPLRAAFRKEAPLPGEIEACLDQLHRIRFRA